MDATKKRIAVARYEELQIGYGQTVKIDDLQIALFKITDGRVFAIEDKSPHPKGGVLSEGLVSGEYVFCPVYDLKISLVTGMVQAPDTGQVTTYEVDVTDGVVSIIL
ncbi:nitrite reductase small subunit NirD [Bacillus sp. HMF5848]|uniref:nitrite reductase small subunit NirD n=1 Tax=Bacillus sp. HMF5848 TaxID=2495421 RepID=UPI000F7B596F|nr:nitrite reductase small subunit NirD [Bacillus sp. HMF5848]RSK26016.1 nitrite reductase small subunit NirD [Bacillus sp. HMF5848]